MNRDGATSVGAFAGAAIALGFVALLVAQDPRGLLLIIAGAILGGFTS